MSKINKMEYLTNQQVADILGVKSKTITYWRCTGKLNIDVCKLGRVILYPADAFYAWLESNTSNKCGGC